MDLFNPFKKSNREPGKNHRPQPKTPPPYNVCENPDRPSQKAIIYQSELDFISRCILDYPDIETGGQIFGYWTSTGVPVVMEVIGPEEMRSIIPHRLYKTSDICNWSAMNSTGNSDSSILANGTLTTNLASLIPVEEMSIQCNTESANPVSQDCCFVLEIAPVPIRQ